MAPSLILSQFILIFKTNFPSKHCGSVVELKVAEQEVPGSNPGVIFLLLEKSVFLALKVSVAQFISAKIQLAGTCVKQKFRGLHFQ